jgi:hypothetical protein
VASNSALTVSGLHSTVTSASSTRGIASSTAANAPAGTIDGVPPPKKTLVAAGIPAATARSMSMTTAAR